MSQKVFLVFGNIDAVIPVQDFMEHVRESLRAIGVDALYAADPEPDAINIFVEYFDDERLEKYLEVKRRYPATRYIVIASELVTGQTFNDIGMSAAGHAHYSNREYWKSRFDNFLKFATYCDDVWELCSPPHNSYKKLFKNTDIKVSYFPHCSTGTVRFSELNWEEKDIDVFFSGSLTNYRKGILKILEDAGLTVVCRLPGRTPNFVRESYVRRAKVCLGLKLDGNSPCSSPGRTHYYLMRGVRHISEDTPMSMDIDKYIRRFRKSDLLDMVKTCVEDADSLMPDFKCFHEEMTVGRTMHEIACSSAFYQFKLPHCGGKM